MRRMDAIFGVVSVLLIIVSGLLCLALARYAVGLLPPDFVYHKLVVGFVAPLVTLLVFVVWFGLLIGLRSLLERLGVLPQIK